MSTEKGKAHSVTHGLCCLARLGTAVRFPETTLNIFFFCPLNDCFPVFHRGHGLFSSWYLHLLIQCTDFMVNEVRLQPSGLLLRFSWKFKGGGEIVRFCFENMQVNASVMLKGYTK